MGCEILDYGRSVTGDKKLQCGEICKQTRRCPLIHGRYDIFPKPEEKSESFGPQVLDVASVGQEVLT